MSFVYSNKHICVLIYDPVLRSVTPVDISFSFKQASLILLYNDRPYLVSPLQRRILLISQRGLEKKLPVQHTLSLEFESEHIRTHKPVSLLRFKYMIGKR